MATSPLSQLITVYDREWQEMQPGVRMKHLWADEEQSAERLSVRLSQGRNCHYIGMWVMSWCMLSKEHCRMSLNGNSGKYGVSTRRMCTYGINQNRSNGVGGHYGRG